MSCAAKKFMVIRACVYQVERRLVLLFILKTTQCLLYDRRDLAGSFSSAMNCLSKVGARAPWKVQSEPEP